MGVLKSRLKRFVGATSAEQNLHKTTEKFPIDNNQDDRPSSSRLDIAHRVVQSSPKDISSSLPGPTEIPEVGNIHVANLNQTESSVSLWDMAYDALREERRDLIVAYEVILSQAFVNGEKGTSSVMETKALDNQIPQNDVMARRDMLKKITELGLKHMEDKEVTVTVLGHEIVLNDAMASVAGGVEWAEGYVKAAVKDLPYASIVMAGVSLILPLLTTSFAVEAANREGFTYVTSQMRYYIKMESLRLPPDLAVELKSSLTEGVTDLYMLIIEFQVESVIRFYRSRTKNYFRGTINYDSWEEKLSRIKELEASLDKMFERVISGESLQQLKNLAREAKDSRKCLDDMLSKLDKLIDLSGNQTKIMEKEEQRLSQEDNRRCQRALQATDPVLDKERILLKKDKLLRDSYCWVLETNEFQEWRNDPASRLLWLTGDPGKGKTMLICGIIDEMSKLRETTDRSNICYFFFQATDDRINSAVAVLRGLTYMLVKEQPSLMKYLRETLSSDGDRHFEGPNAWVALSKVLIDMLEDAELQDTYLILDALDECCTDLDLLLGFIAEISSSYAKVKWITSSRNWPNIEKGLKSTLKRRLCIELNEESVSGAVDSYIRTKVNWLSQRNDYDEETRGAIQQYLQVNANGTFLWVALICKELANISGWEAEELVIVFPPGLDDLYDRMLGQIRSSRHASLCRNILAVLLLVHRPITLAELTSLVEMPPRISRNPKALEEVVGLCGSFLALQQHTVSFIHQSAKDFLLENESAELFPQGPEDFNHKIFLRSLHTIANTLRRDIYGLGAPGRFIEDLSPPDPDPLAPARYACVFWVDHLVSCDPLNRESDDFCEGGIVDMFLQRDFLHWLESLCLLGALPQGIASILSLENLVQKMSGSSQLSDRVRDACRFTRYHNGLIAKYPLQIYVSALTFSPVKSLTRDSYTHEEPAWLLRKPQVEDNWSSCVQSLEEFGVSSLCWSPDGTRIASASYSTTSGFKIWDPVTSQCISWPVVPNKNEDGFGRFGSCFVTWSKDTPFGCGEENERLSIWNLTTGECISTFEGHKNHSLREASISYSQHQSLIATGLRDGSIQIWNSGTGQCISTLSGHSEAVQALSWAPSGRLLASGSGDSTAKIWDVVTWQCTSTFSDHRDFITSVAWSPDGKLLASCSASGAIFVWDWETDRSICVSPQRRYDNYTVLELQWSQDGSRLASSSSDHIKIWNTKNYQCISTLYGHVGGIGSVAWSQDGARLASGSQDGTIKIWEPEVDQQKSSKMEDHSERITALVMSPDEMKLASASVDTDIKIWDLSTGNVTLTLSGHTNEVSSLAWSPNGSEIASASWDGCLKLWNTTTAECISTLNGDHELLEAVAWSPDNARLATASLHGVITVWDSKAYRCLFTIKDELPGAWHWALAWSPDGSRIGLGSRYGRVKIWDASTRDCVASFDQRDVFAGSGSWQSHKTLVHLRALLEISDYAPDTHGSLSIPTAASNYDLDDQYEWITYSDEPILRLPTEYQPNVSIVGKNFIGVGCHSGRVLLLQFSDVNPLK